MSYLTLKEDREHGRTLLVQEIGRGEVHLILKAPIGSDEIRLTKDQVDQLQDYLHNVNVWKRVALFLADCHAATTEHFRSLKGTSKSERNRLKSIAHKAARMLRGQDVLDRQRPASEIVKRLIQAGSVEP